MKEFKSKICPNCGKEFIPKFSPKQKYCDSHKGGAKTCKVYNSLIQTGKKNLIVDEPIENDAVFPKVLLNDIELKIRPIKQDIKVVALEIQKMKEDFFIIKNRLDKIDRGGFLAEEITELENYLVSSDNRLSKNNLSTTKRTSILITRKSAITRLKELQNVKADVTRKKEIESTYLFKNIHAFRLIEKCNDNVQFLVPKNDKIDGTLNSILMKYKTYYPFGELVFNGDYKSFDCLGRLSQPFFGCLTGERNSGTTRTSIKICKDLVDFFGFKILYIGNIEQINNEFSELVYSEINSNLFAYKACNSKFEITKLLDREPYELVVIDPICHFHIDYNFIYQLQKQHPKLSIIGILKSNTESLKRNAHVIIDTKNGMGVAVKGGNSSYNISAWEGANYYHDTDEEHYENEY